MVSVSIDKIVLLSEMPTGELQSVLNKYLIAKKTYPLKNSYVYSYGFELFDGSFLQLGSYYNARLTFNPNGCLPVILNDILPLFQKYKFSVSRLDIAIDYRLDLSRYVWFEKSGRRRIKPFHTKNGELKGVYFGRRKSNATYIIYNKGLKEGLNESLWRVEARIKYPTLDNILPTDLFETLCAGGVSLFPPKDSHLNRLRRFPEYIKKLSAYRRKVARELAMKSEDRLYTQPAEVYEQFRSEMFSSLSRYILIPPTSNNYTLLDTYDISNDLISFKYFMPET